MKITTKFATLLTAAFATVSAWAGIDISDVRVGGFLSNGYLESSHYNYPADTDGGTYDFAELGFNASWTPKDRLTINGQVFAFELGPYGNYDPLLDYLFFDYNVRRAFGIRLGRVKRESGIYTHVQDIDLSRTSILLPMGMYDQRFRDFSAALDGVSIYGNLDLWENAYLDYNAYSGSIDLEPEGGVGGIALTSLSRFAENIAIGHIKSKSIHGVQLWLSPGLEGFRAGLSMSQIPDVSASVTGNVSSFHPNPFYAGQPLTSEFSDFTLNITQFSLEYFVGDWNFIGEYSTTDTSYDSSTTIAGFPVSSGSSQSESSVWYVSAARRFGAIEGALTYVKNNSEADILSNGNGGFPNTEDLQFSLRYDVTDYWTLKAEIHSITGTDRLFNEYYQNPVLDEESWTLFAAKSTFFF